MVSRKILTSLFLLGIFNISLAANCYNCATSENFDCQANTENLNKSKYFCEGNLCMLNTIDGVVTRYCSDGSNVNFTTDKFCNNADFCNSQAYRFDCVSCNSTNENCKTNVSLVTDTCQSSACYSFTDSNGNVNRGCDDCSLSNPTSCTTCKDGVKCNNQTFQSCYQCNYENCIETTSTTTITQCPANKICFTRLTSDGLVERGCTTNDFQCDASSCSTCNGDNCNNKVYPENRLSCLQCNGTAECNDGSIAGKYCSKYFANDTCFSYADASNQMIRGCSSDDILNNCTDTNCETCNLTNCNTIKFNERPSKMKCYQCDKDCHDSSNLNSSFCRVYPFNAEEKCYTFTDINTNTVERGCYYDTVGIAQKCTNETVCQTCSEDDCNDESVITCYECTDCLNTTETTAWKQCASGASCITKINELNQVIRSCSDKKCADNEENCKTCENDKCNSGVFPKDRQSCLQCDSLLADDDCAQGLNSTLKLCQIYKKDDKCFFYADGNNTIHRGCSADEKRLNCTSDNHCEECDNLGCNSKELYQQSNRTCVKCVNCTDDLPSEEKCNSSHLYYEIEQCYTQNITEGNITTQNRGCLLELTNQETCGASCIRCQTDGCNKHGDDYEEFPDFKCVICHSTKDDCATNQAEHCKPVPTSLNGGIGCYVERRDNVVIRDCISNAKQLNTTLSGKNVKTCFEDSCNTMVAPGSAVTTQVSVALLIALIALLFPLNNII